MYIIIYIYVYPFTESLFTIAGLIKVNQWLIALLNPLFLREIHLGGGGRLTIAGWCKPPVYRVVFHPLLGPFRIGKNGHPNCS